MYDDEPKTGRYILCGLAALIVLIALLCVIENSQFQAQQSMYDSDPGYVSTAYYAQPIFPWQHASSSYYHRTTITHTTYIPPRSSSTHSTSSSYSKSSTTQIKVTNARQQSNGSGTYQVKPSKVRVSPPSTSSSSGFKVRPSTIRVRSR